MRIYDGREAFSQWDIGVMLTSPDFKIGDEVHITNTRLPNAMTVSVYDYNGKAVVDVPNILLQTTYPIVAFRYVNDGKSGYTVERYEFNINQKPKPDDYVYTETEVLTITTAVEKALLEAKESGEFKGEPGEKGDPGEPGKDGKDGKDGEDGVGVGTLTVTTDDGEIATHTFDQIQKHVYSGGIVFFDWFASSTLSLVSFDWNYNKAIFERFSADDNTLLIVMVDSNGYVELRQIKHPQIEDDSVTGYTTWSSQKISQEIGKVETALDGIIAIQNELIGGGE